MPDWSYRTLFRPLLQQLPPRTARSLTLRSMGAISRIPGGTLLIKTLGHMEPSPLLASDAGGVILGTPVGLSGEVDPEGLAQRALAQLGFGFVWIGPVTSRERSATTVSPRILMDHSRETILYPDGPEQIHFDEAIERVRKSGHRLPSFTRLTPMPGATPEQASQQLERMIRQLDAAGAAGFGIDIPPSEQGRRFNDYISLIGRLKGIVHTKPLFWHLPANLPDAPVKELVAALAHAEWTGIVIGPGCENDNPSLTEAGGDGRNCLLTAGPGQLDRTLAIVRKIKGCAGPAFVIQAAAGIHEPIDALRAMDAGADHILLNSGFVYGGPGLPKRINDAILYEKVKRLKPELAQASGPRPKSVPVPPETAEHSFWQNWGWMCLLGIGMMIGGLIAWIIAVSSVLLPYDEDFLGMTWKEVRQLHPHLLHFMSHDRITLAGTMISIGILYYMLARHGMRYGRHWARTAVLTSCLIGFPSFFLYLGYGYLDPLHAGAAIVLLPMFLLSMRLRRPERPTPEPVNLRSDRLWRRAVWGQLIFVALGIALAVGGLTIAGVGITRVFVPSDLAYLNLTTEQLDAINPRLIPLIAHDRAGFGGALLANAAALLATALWGIQQGARWLWATLLLGGAPAFYAAISVHFSIGYVDTIHLLPAYFAVFLYVTGLILLYPYMMRKPEPYVPESAAASP